MNFKPTYNYNSPGGGLPASDPFPTAAKPHWFRRKRKRPNPKNPWFFVFSGDCWRKPHSHEFYRVHISHRPNMDIARIDFCRKKGDPGQMRHENFFRFIGPELKRLIISEHLTPVKRPNKERTGIFLRLWGWPPGIVTD